MVEKLKHIFFLFFCTKFLTPRFQNATKNSGNGYWIREQYNFERISINNGFVALMATTGYSEECACSMNS
jgi:hypothetical protein